MPKSSQSDQENNDFEPWSVYGLSDILIGLYFKELPEGGTFSLA